MADSDKPNSELLDLKQLKSIKVALWTLVTVFVILPVIAGIGTGVVIGFIALKGGDSHPEAKTEDRWDTGVIQSTPMETKHGGADERGRPGEPVAEGQSFMVQPQSGSDEPQPTDGDADE